MADPIDKAFIQLINQNLGIAHKVCKAYFRDQADREDAMQEMMYQLWKSFHRFDGLSKFSTWMYRVCLNTALTYRRKNRNMESLTPLHDQVKDQNPENREETIAILFDAISTLSQMNKAIVLLYMDDMSYEDIASITGLSKSNVSVRLVRIKRELEIILTEKLK